MSVGVLATAGLVVSLIALVVAFGAVWFARSTAGPTLAAQIQQLAHEFTEQIKSLRREFAGLTGEWGDALDRIATKQKQTQAAAARAAKTERNGAPAPGGFDPMDPEADRQQLGAWLRAQGRL